MGNYFINECLLIDWNYVISECLLIDGGLCYERMMLDHFGIVSSVNSRWFI